VQDATAFHPVEHHFDKDGNEVKTVDARNLPLFRTFDLNNWLVE
jgi:hypothetical protein